MSKPKETPKPETILPSWDELLAERDARLESLRAIARQDTSSTALELLTKELTLEGQYAIAVQLAALVDELIEIRTALAGLGKLSGLAGIFGKR